ncbi:GTP-binding protein [Arthrobacter echini]|uniref:GTP-binding protein n=1 Tax=Arthrobacter echini TaxID=1529066 RepID=A0A4S5E8A8_9MICC|nr:dynamin family protein [Arthrobacter echini]THJ67858.1 GTP-binding protein [Arthrobacter echini]
MSSTSAAVEELLIRARSAYANDPAACAALDAFADRLREPLRVAIAGMMKAGKSTLLNAIIGEEIAPTDAGECTRIVTWYRWSATPRITLHRTGGEQVLLPVRRIAGRLEFELGGLRPEDVERLVVDWPAESLRRLTLIDTPGIASLSSGVSERSLRLLTPGDNASEADAVIYLMRHLHASDLSFLEAFRDDSTGSSGTVNALAVLSRADEVGAGRIDSLISAAGIADRYRSDPSLRALALDVVPIAGLLAQSARTLRQEEFRALAVLAALERDVREKMLLSADRFVRADAALQVDQGLRASLLDRFGVFGIRLACALLRGGVDSSSELADELARRSGLDQLLQLVERQFRARSDQLRARAVLTGVGALARADPSPQGRGLLGSIERIETGAHQLRELRVLSALRSRAVPLSALYAQDAERLVGGSGVSAAQRLALDDDASPDDISSTALAELRRWRLVAENPLTDRTAVEACQVVVRSCEQLVRDHRQPDREAAGGPGSRRVHAGSSTNVPEPAT